MPTDGRYPDHAVVPADALEAIRFLMWPRGHGAEGRYSAGWHGLAVTPLAEIILDDREKQKLTQLVGSLGDLYGKALAREYERARRAGRL